MRYKLFQKSEHVLLHRGIQTRWYDHQNVFRKSNTFLWVFRK